MMNLYVLALLVFGVIQDVAGQDSATGTCTDGGAKRYANPTHCHKYFVCSRKQTTALNCEAGEMFDSKLKVCAPESQVDCGERIKFGGANRIGSCRMLLCTYTYGSQLPISGINPELCTHIHIQRAAYWTFTGVAFVDENSRRAAVDLLSLKKRNPNLKFTLIIQDTWSYRFPHTANSSESRQLLVNTAISLIREINYDGLQFGWWIPHEGPDLYLSLLKDTMTGIIREASESGKPRLLLFHVVGMKPYLLSKGFYRVEQIHLNVDFTILHGMDLEGPYRKHIGHHSGPKAISQTIDEWISKGHPADKLILNLPLFSCGFQLADPSNTNIGAPTTGHVITNLPIHIRQCAVSYPDTCRLIQTYNFTTVYNDVLGAPYMYRDKFWLGYDDQYSLKYKVILALERGLAGVSANALNYDDYRGSTCGKLTYPLLKALVSACRAF